MKKINLGIGKCGLITYHSAYNFGSVLQAYAMQQTLSKVGYATDIINYRMAEQKEFYQVLYRTKYGSKLWLKDTLMRPCQGDRIARMQRFENFFSAHFDLTPEVGEPEAVSAQWHSYDVVVSGSDQIWNKHSCELEHNDWKYMDPYLLKGFTGRKISYASSVGGMTEEELQRILPELKSFDALAFREAVTAKKMAVLLERSVATVLDPTFLLTKDEWIAHLQLQKKDDEKYILFYSLGGSPKQLLHLLPVLSKLAKKRDCKVKVVTPFTYIPYPNKHIEYHPEYGPIEFMDALYNAEVVITGSYHGTILSVNFGKEFYSICKSGGGEFRKTDILDRLGLQDRIISDTTVILNLALPPIDYATVYAKLADMRQHSMDYLITNLIGEKNEHLLYR